MTLWWAACSGFAKVSSPRRDPCVLREMYSRWRLCSNQPQNALHGRRLRFPVELGGTRARVCKWGRQLSAPSACSVLGGDAASPGRACSQIVEQSWLITGNIPPRNLLDK